MELPGWNTVAGVIAKIVNNFIPSKKAALVDELNALIFIYKAALENREDTRAAILRKQISEIRKKLDFTDEDI